MPPFGSPPPTERKPWPPLPEQPAANLLCLPGAPINCPPPAVVITAADVLPAALRSLPPAGFDAIVGAAAEPDWLPALARLLQPAGRLYLNPRLAPDTRLRGKIARRTAAAAAYLNAVYAFAAPGALPAHTQSGWARAISAAGLKILAFDQIAEPADFAGWAAPLTPDDRIRLRALLQQAPPLVQEFLTLQFSGDRITFQVTAARLTLTHQQ